MTNVFHSNWLKNLPERDISAFKAACEPVWYSDGDFIYTMGSHPDQLFGVAEGQVRVHVATNELKPVLAHIHTPASWLGEIEFVLREPSYVSMEASGDTRVFRIHGKSFRALAGHHPLLWESVARLASLNLKLAISAANDLVHRTAQKRMAAVILRLSGHRAAFQNNVPVDAIRASQSEVAALSNTARTTAWQILKRFQKDGLVALEYGCIRVLNTQGLTALLEERK
jgi:CRP-like cAMP-binding protein